MMLAIYWHQWNFSAVIFRKSNIDRFYFNGEF